MKGRNDRIFSEWPCVHMFEKFLPSNRSGFIRTRGKIENVRHLLPKECLLDRVGTFVFQTKDFNVGVSGWARCKSERMPIKLPKV